MEDIEDFSDDRHKAWCVQCGGTIGNRTTNWDHVPTKGLLDRPLPHHVPQIEVCEACNNGFSLDEEYLVTFLSCVLSGSTAPDAQRNRRSGGRFNEIRHLPPGWTLPGMLLLARTAQSR
jgi:hypothetical protein